MAVVVAKESSNTWTWVAMAGGCIALVVTIFVLFVEAPPPTRIVIAAGSKEGGYYQFARQYAELLKRDGVTLEIINTKGSVENIELLLDENSDVTVGFVQSGIADPEQCDRLQSLCSLYREPLWIFYRGFDSLDRLSQLDGKRVAIGPEGSGTRAIALQLLKANGLDTSHEDFVPASGIDAAEALMKQEIDAAFFVSGIEGAHIQKLINDPEIRLANLSQADAYLRRFRFLSGQTIPRGLFDLKRDLPASDTMLIAPAATLVIHKSLHPALISLLLKTATKVHQKGGLLAKAGEFPSVAFTDLPVSEDAEHYFRFGPPVLQRVLPFWLASLVDRMKLMVIPLIMLMMPLIRATPPLVRWRTRRKIYMWYSRLHRIDQLAIQGMSTTEAQSSLEELAALEHQIAHVGIPLSYMEEYYNLRLHLNLVRGKVEAILAPGSQVHRMRTNVA